jgi:hypothetical protein
MSAYSDGIQSGLEELGVSWSVTVRNSSDCKELTSQIRCREVDWRSRWYWGLECLNLSSESDSQLTATFDSEYEGREAERWLKSTRVSAKELDVS